MQSSEPISPVPRRWVLLAVIAGLGFVALAVLILVTGGGDGPDSAVSRAVGSVASPSGRAVGRVVTWFGSVEGVVLLTVAGAIVLAIRARRLLEPAAFMVAVALSSSLVYLLKIAIGRHRPTSALSLGEAVTDYSFPSGHTTSGTVVFALGGLLLAGTIGRSSVRRLVLVTGVAAAALIGLSRIYLGYHWATDVLAGWLLATTLLSVAMTVVVVGTRSAITDERLTDTDLSETSGRPDTISVRLLHRTDPTGWLPAHHRQHPSDPPAIAPISPDPTPTHTRSNSSRSHPPGT